MSGPENTFIASVHRLLPTVQELYRMKNHNPFNSGQADCWYSARRDLWVEYKFVVVPQRDETVIVPGLSALQTDWCTSRLDEGRNVLVIVGCKQGGVVMRNPNDWVGMTRAAFVPQIETRQAIAQFLIKEVS